MRTTLADAKADRLAEAVNCYPEETRFLQYLNSATQRLLHRGKFWGSYARYRISVTSQLLTLPPYIDTIEAIALSRIPLPLREYWCEFLETGWGTRDDSLQNTGISECLLRGNFPTIVDITTPSVLFAYCDLLDDVDKAPLILGYDANGNWVRTQDPVTFEWHDGEYIELDQLPGVLSTTVFSQITDIQVPSSMEGQWFLYLGSVSGTLLGRYQYWETRPSWKRYTVPFNDTGNLFVELVGKKSFVPVRKDTDYLVIGNLAALKLAMMAVKSEEEYNFGLASMLWNGGTDKRTGQQVIGAMQELNSELDHHLGSGATRTIHVEPTPGFEPIVDIR